MPIVANGRHLMNDESEWLRQDRQCAYNVTLGRVRVTTAVVEKQ